MEPQELGVLHLRQSFLDRAQLQMTMPWAHETAAVQQWPEVQVPQVAQMPRQAMAAALRRSTLVFAPGQLQVPPPPPPPNHRPGGFAGLGNPGAAAAAAAAAASLQLLLAQVPSYKLSAEAPEPCVAGSLDPDRHRLNGYLA